MTDVQWDNFRDGLGGLWIVKWQARIRDVGDKSFLVGGYPMYIHVTSDCEIYYVISDEQTALQYSKGQQITFTGQIDFIGVLFGSITIYVEDFTVEIE